MVANRDHRRVYARDTQQAGSEDNKYIDREAQLLKIIEDSALDEKGIMSADELVSSFEVVGPHKLKMQILTREGKGLVKKTRIGYNILTETGKERLQNND